MRACWVAIHGFESFALWVIFFFNDTATTEIYTLSLHDALPISLSSWPWDILASAILSTSLKDCDSDVRSEEHTSELQSQSNLVCRLLLEKKKKKITPIAKYYDERTQKCTSYKSHNDVTMRIAQK